MKNEGKDNGKGGNKESAALLSMPEFIANVVAKARAQQGVDDGLLTILEEHIVRLEPSSSAVDDALSAIDALAESRATKKGETNGGPDHD